MYRRGGRSHTEQINHILEHSWAGPNLGTALFTVQYCTILYTAWYCTDNIPHSTA